MPTTGRMLRALSKLNARHPWSHNEFYSPMIIRYAKRTRSEGGRHALDVGTGTGELARRLATVFDRVVAIEPDHDTAAIARERLRETAGVELREVPLSAVKGETFDFISLVAVLHHLPLQETLQSLRTLLNPGGRLVVVGLTSSDLTGWDAASLFLNPVVGLIKLPRATTEPPVSMTAPVAPATETIDEIAGAMDSELGNVRIRHGLFWRYTAIWNRPLDD